MFLDLSRPDLVDLFLDLANLLFLDLSRPDLVDWKRVEKMRVRERIELAFHVMDREYGVTRLLDPEGELFSMICPMSISRFLRLAKVYDGLGARSNF